MYKYMDIVLIGSGQYCRMIINTIEKMSDYEIIGIVDNERQINEKIYNIPILGNDDDSQKIFDYKCKNAYIAIGSTKDQSIRKKLYSNLKNIGFSFPVIIDNTAIISERILIKQGTFIAKGAIVNNDVVIGENCIINTGAIVEHDTIIGNNAHIAPGSVICGGVTIGDGTHIGANTTIIQGIKIGNDCVIGAGSVVVRNIDDNKTAFGNPCKCIN